MILQIHSQGTMNVLLRWSTSDGGGQTNQRWRPRSHAASTAKGKRSVKLNFFSGIGLNHLSQNFTRILQSNKKVCRLTFQQAAPNLQRDWTRPRTVTSSSLSDVTSHFQADCYLLLASANNSSSKQHNPSWHQNKGSGPRLCHSVVN